MTHMTMRPARNRDAAQLVQARHEDRVGPLLISMLLFSFAGGLLGYMAPILH